MKLSSLIDQLQQIRQEEGDIEITRLDGQPLTRVELWEDAKINALGKVVPGGVVKTVQLDDIDTSRRS